MFGRFCCVYETDANEINDRRAANEFVNAPTHRVNTVDKHGNETSAPAWGLDMAESIAAHKRATFPNDKTEIVATGATEYTTEINSPEFSELPHAAQCLDIYLHNTREIYDRYTVPAIDVCAKAQTVKAPKMWEYIKQALKVAARLVIKYDGISPTADDIKAVTANYVAYITECAEYNATTA